MAVYYHEGMFPPRSLDWDEGIVIEVMPHRGSSPAVLAFPELLRIVEDVRIVVGHE